MATSADAAEETEASVKSFSDNSISAASSVAISSPSENKPAIDSSSKAKFDKKQTMTMWGVPYGMAERVQDGKNFNARRFVRSYICGFHFEYDYKAASMFTVGFKTGYEGVILHVGGYKNQVPLMATIGFIPYESSHSRIDVALGAGFDIIESAVDKTFAPLADFSVSYRYKIGDFSLGAAADLRFEYTISNKDIRFEIMPIKLGIGYSF